VPHSTPPQISHGGSSTDVSRAAAACFLVMAAALQSRCTTNALDPNAAAPVVVSAPTRL
jgi:hypothetical protein